MNNSETVQYVRSDRSWVAALLGVIAGSLLGAILMGVAVLLMLWTTRPPTATESDPAETAAHSANNGRIGAGVSSGASSAFGTSGGTGEAMAARVGRGPLAIENATDSTPASAYADEMPADEVAPHGPQSKATIELYELPGAHPD